MMKFLLIIIVCLKINFIITITNNGGKFFTDCGNNEFQQFHIGHCRHTIAECFISMNNSFNWYYQLVGNQNTDKIIANLMIREKQIFRQKINLCKQFPDIVDCPMKKNLLYDNHFDINLMGNFNRNDRNSKILPIEIYIDIYGDHGQLACAHINLNITK